jgi:hypothetical protein
LEGPNARWMAVAKSYMGWSMARNPLSSLQNPG